MMSRKTAQIVAVAAAVIAAGVMSVATTPASAGNFRPALVNWPVAGSLTAKKLSQTITLPPGSVFNGQGDVELAEGWEKIHGTINGKVFVPPFNATLTIFGVPTPLEVAITFDQVGEVEGVINSIPFANCGFTREEAELEGCLEARAPTTANIAFTGVFALGLRLPTRCETATPMIFPTRDVLSFGQLVDDGVHASGKATIPSFTCEGPEGLALGTALTAALSGPGNPYALSISP